MTRGNGQGLGRIPDFAAAPANLAALVLAAGGSSRYGRCKQLVVVNGASLVCRAVAKLAPLLPPERIGVVVGAEWEAVERELAEWRVNIVRNPHWRQGLASSLKAGINSLPSECAAALVTLCDQPLVSSQSLRQLLNLWAAQPRRISAAQFAGAVGAPAIFPRDFYPELLELEGDAGAKSVMARHPERLVALPIPEAEFDLDTPADLEKLQRRLATPSTAER